jgi:hypothetical protein
MQPIPTTQAGQEHSHDRFWTGAAAANEPHTIRRPLIRSIDLCR